jgi:sulfate permease, SulP family
MRSIRFYRVGGGTRFAGFLLALCTGLLLLIGTTPIGFIREYVCDSSDISLKSSVLAIMVVGALIFVLGMDLIKEVRRLQFSKVLALNRL